MDVMGMFDITSFLGKPGTLSRSYIAHKPSSALQFGYAFVIAGLIHPPYSKKSADRHGYHPASELQSYLFILGPKPETPPRCTS